VRIKGTPQINKLFAPTPEGVEKHKKGLNCVSGSQKLFLKTKSLAANKNTKHNQRDKE
jgi:hypothetical protein